MPGSKSAFCPYCDAKLEKFPSRKAKCKICGEFIYVRTSPKSGQKILVTLAGAEEIERFYENEFKEHQEKQALENFEKFKSYNEKYIQQIIKDKFPAVEIMMSTKHVGCSICEGHASANLYGLGPGLYPPDKAPIPPFHVGCLCKMSPRSWVDGAS